MEKQTNQIVCKVDTIKEILTRLKLSFKGDVLWSCLDDMIIKIM